MAFRDRVLGLEQIPVVALLPHPQNWRKHPLNQRNALRGVLDEVGFAVAIIARPLGDGTYQILDGHLRAESLPDETLPVLLVDLDDDEAKRFLVSADPLAAMAEADKRRVGDLLLVVATANVDLERLLSGLATASGVDVAPEAMAPVLPRGDELPAPARPRATPGGDAAPPAADPEDGTDHVRMVQLVFQSEAEYGLFLGCVESLGARLRTTTITDTVFNAVALTAKRRLPFEELP